MVEGYVTSDGKVINEEESNKKRLIMYTIIAGIIILIIIIYFIARFFVRRNYCQKVIDNVSSVSLSYLKKNKELPVEEGDFVTLELAKLIDERLIQKEDITVNKKVAKGTIKVTKVKDNYIPTILLTDCDYCDSSNKNWSSEISEKPKTGIIEPIAYYNYFKVQKNYTNWTKWFENKDINTDIDKKYKIRLPKEVFLPKVPSDAKIDVIEQETKEYYRYRDKKWKYFDIVGVYTSYFSSEQPEGYADYDKNTEIYTEWSKESLDYPETKPYRTIIEKAAYKWFYMDGNKKVYYKSGEYTVTNPNAKKYTSDKDAGSTKMYSYRDKQWRWYNGQKRKYSSFSSVMPRGYTYRDDALVINSGWSNYRETTSITPEVAPYREEETDTRFRYRIKYYVETFDVLKKDVTVKDLESNLNQTIEEIMSRDDIKVKINFKYRTKKVS
jgi:hypothetical protein